MNEAPSPKASAKIKGLVKAHIDFMQRLNKELRDAGELVGGEGLTGPGKARLVRAGKDGRPVTDGVFPETKEFLAGYWIIDVDRPERAYKSPGKPRRRRRTRPAEHGHRGPRGYERFTRRGVTSPRSIAAPRSAYCAS